MSGGHAHAHGGALHPHGEPSALGRRFAIGVVLNLVYVAAEAFWGVRGHSLALLADAGHNLSDVLGLVLSWGAWALARTPPSGRRTYGLRRASTLAALGNALLLLIAVGAIVWEAIGRLRTPEPVAGGMVMAVAGVGIVINTATALLFAGGRGDLNVRGAYLHMAADAGVSLGVVLAGLAIRLTGAAWVDPVTSLAVAAVILVATWGLLRESVELSIDAVPKGIDLDAVAACLADIDGVTAVHDLHVWGMSTTEAALTAHLVVPGGIPGDAFHACLAKELHDRFGIEHVTVQVEHGDGATCPLERPGTV